MLVLRVSKGEHFPKHFPSHAKLLLSDYKAYHGYAPDCIITIKLLSTQMPRDWEDVQITVIRPGPIPTSSPCGNTIPDDDRLTVSLPAAARSAEQEHKHTRRIAGR